MVLSNIKDIIAISDLSDDIRKALLVISKIKKDINNGRYEIDGDKIFYMVSEYETHSDDLRMEAHRKYIDIQYVLDGEEYINVTDRENLDVNIPYTDDIIFYNMPAEYIKIKMNAGSVAIFYPQDAHCPCVACGNIGKVKKIVVKVAV